MKTKLIIIVLSLLLLSCNSEDPINTCKNKTIYEDKIVEVDKIIYKSIYKNICNSSNKTIINTTQDRFLELIRQNKRLDKLAKSCYFINITERELNLTRNLDSCKKELEDC